MKFVEKLVDMGAPEYFVTGPASVERISQGLIRVTYYVRRNEGNIVPLHTIWDYEEYMAGFLLYEQAYIELREPWTGVNAEKRRKEAH